LGEPEGKKMPELKQITPLQCSTIADYRAWRASTAGSLGVLLTMGALHEGHLSIIRKARAENDQVAVSIFVNPLQFGPNEDFEKYPRTVERDIELCGELGVNAIFMPTNQEMYPEGKDNCMRIVPPAQIADVLEGHFRPGFFTGVATVVAKLFSVMQPTISYFGEKDYQQLTIVKKMVKDLNLPLLIEGCPTVREPDGLALSSRNVYMNSAQREKALLLRKSLLLVAESVSSSTGQADLTKAVAAGRKLFDNEPDFELQYIDVRDAETFAEPTGQSAKLVALIAAKLGPVRLIDNIAFKIGQDL
jgi:pantoate--beta-alanine ligase